MGLFWIGVDAVLPSYNTGCNARIHAQLLQRQFPGSVRVRRLVGMKAVRACPHNHPHGPTYMPNRLGTYNDPL